MDKERRTTTAQRKGKVILTLLNGLELCGWSASETNSENQDDERKEPCLMDIIRLNYRIQGHCCSMFNTEQQKLLL